jgi:hypothetical protein
MHMARVRRAAAEWVALIDQWQDSRLSMPAFCQQHGLNPGTMSGWVYKRTHRRALEEARREAAAPPAHDRASPTATPAFLPVQVAEAVVKDEAPIGTGVEVVLGPGRRVVVSPGFDAETLRRVVAVLEAQPC